MAKRIKEQISIHELVKKLQYYRELYYNGQPEISDTEFDELEETLRKLSPNHYYFKTVGAKEKNDSIKVHHDFPMLSMDKIKDPKELYTYWLEKNNLPPTTMLSVGPKIDGISLTCRYDKGVFIYAATRGDGKNGSIINHVEHIRGIPERIPYDDEIYEIRGELYIDQHVREINPESKDWSLRNYCYGLISRKDLSSDIQYVNFVAYDMVLQKRLMPGPVSHKIFLDYMRSFCPNVIPQENVTFIKCFEHIKTLEEYFNEYLMTYREQWPYETDGIIVTIDDRRMFKNIDKKRGGADRFHYYNIAIKPPAQSKETKLIDISWEVSRLGNVIPVGVLEPVKIGSVEISNVTLNNAYTVKIMNFTKNCIVRVERANDVIPKLIEVVSQTDIPFEIPTHCPSCGSLLDTNISDTNRHIRCINKQCKGRIVSQMYYWVTKNNIKDIGIKTIEDLYNVGVRSIADLYTVNIDEILSSLKGYTSGGSKTTKINEELERTKGISQRDLIARIGIPSVGEAIVDKYNINSIEDLLEYKKDRLYKYEAEKNIHEWISDQTNEELIKSLARVLNATVIQNTKNEVIAKGNAIYYCITGQLPIERDDFIKRLEPKGYVFIPSVSSKLHFLLCGENGEGTTKYKKAQAYNIPIKSIYDIPEIQEMLL